MIITWIGHSCFKLESNGYAVVIDPYADGYVDGLGNVREEASAVFCSHGHGDHGFREGVRIVPSSAVPFSVDCIDTYHDDAGGALRGPDRIHILDDGSCRIAHLGDLGCRPDGIDRLYGLDVLLVPVGGHYTIDGKEAAALVKELKPRIAIPVHYRSDNPRFGFDVLSTADDFLSCFGDIEYAGTSSIDTADSHKGIVVLVPRNLIPA